MQKIYIKTEVDKIYIKISKYKNSFILSHYILFFAFFFIKIDHVD